MPQPDREPPRRRFWRAAYRDRGPVLAGVVGALGVLALASLEPHRPAAGPAPGAAPAAAAAMPAPVRLPAAEADAAVAGWVIDGSGAPVAGVELSLTRGAEVHEAVAVTDADGAFRLGELAAGEATLLLDGDAIFPAQVHWQGEGTARILATRRVAIAARVVDAAGRPAAGAAVYLSDGSGQEPSRAEAGPGGQVRFGDLYPGSYQLWAEAGATASPLVRTTRAGAAADSPVELILAPATALSGQVLDSAGAGVAATVTLAPIDLDHAARRLATDAAGRFWAPALPRGRWRIGVDAPGYLASRDYVVDARGERARIDLRVRRGGRVAGTVVDARGQPVAGAVIRLQRQGRRQLEAPARSLAAAALRWVHPLAGQRHLPVRDSRRFGAARDGERPLECGAGHCGVDVGGQAQRGHVVHAASSGVLARVVPDGRGDAGRFVAVEHGGGLTTFYMHLDEVRGDLEVGQPVRAGQPLGTLGASGVHHSEAHLHFALSQRSGGRTWFVDPEPMLERALILPSAQVAAATPTLVATRRDAGQAITPLFDLARAPEPTQITTDAAGRFAADGLAPGRYVASAFHAELAPGQSPVFAVRAGASAPELTITLGWGVALYGRVLGPEGPVPGARVSADTGEGEALRTLATAIADADGRYQLPPLAGRITVRASAGGYGSAERQLRLPAADVDTSRRQLDFDLASQSEALRGQLVDPSGFPVRGASVRVIAGPSGVGRSASSDENGLFAIEGLAAGRYRVAVESSAHPVLRAAVDTDGRAELALRPGGALAVELFDAHTGARLAGVPVTARGPDNAAQSRVTDERGAALFSALEPGPYTVRADAAGYVAASTRFTVAAGDATPAQLELARGATLAGVVRDDDGNRVAGARVEVGDSAAVTDQDGRFRLVDVPTGEVELRASGPEGEAAEPLSLYPGDEYVTLELTLQP